MLFHKRPLPGMVRPRVTPDDAQADALRRRRAALDYTPQNGFHKDQRQDRIPPATRWSTPLRPAL